MKVEKSAAVAAAGSQRKLAALLGLTPQAVQQWPSPIPEVNAYRLKEKKPHWFRKGGKLAPKTEFAA